MRRHQLPLPLLAMQAAAAAARDDLDAQTRLWRCGSRCLSDAELVALVLRSGRPGASALDVAREILGQDGVAGLPGLEKQKLSGWAGVGPVKAASLLAAIELSCRLARARMPDRRLLNKRDVVASYLSQRYYESDQEIMGALYLDTRRRLIAEKELYRGPIDRIALEPRAIFSQALLHQAPNFVLFHTHPSGDPAPSSADLAFTRDLVDAGRLLRIYLLDHLIVGPGGRFTSLQNRGMGW